MCKAKIEGQIAILMGIAQIGETLQKLDNTLIKKYDLIEKEGACFTKNYIVHNYEGVHLALIEKNYKRFFAYLKKRNGKND